MYACDVPLMLQITGANAHCVLKTVYARWIGQTDLFLNNILFRFQKISLFSCVGICFSRRKLSNAWESGWKQVYLIAQNVAGLLVAGAFLARKKRCMATCQLVEHTNTRDWCKTIYKCRGKHRNIILIIPLNRHQFLLNATEFNCNNFDSATDLRRMWCSNAFTGHD